MLLDLGDRSNQTGTITMNHAQTMIGLGACLAIVYRCRIDPVPSDHHHLPVRGTQLASPRLGTAHIHKVWRLVVLVLSAGTWYRRTCSDPQPGRCWLAISLALYYIAIMRESRCAGG